MQQAFLAGALILTGFATPAFASFAPIKYSISRDELAARCALLGDRSESWGLDSAVGDYGCRNTDNGNTVKCTAQGRCTDYGGDPRWKRIKAILEGGKAQKANFQR